MVADVATIIADLLQRGIVLTLDGDDHVAAEPISLLTDVDLATLLARKADVTAYLRAESGARATATPPSPTRTSRFTWSPQAAAMMLSTVLERVGYWRETASLEVRPRIEQVMKEYEPTFAELLDAGDYDALRLAAIAMQRQIGDVIGGYGPS